MKKVMLLLLPIIFTMAACNKYPEGPGLSLRSKKARLCNSWQISSAYQNGVDKTSDFNTAFAGYVININKDDTYSSSYNPFSLGTVSESGHWAFSDDKTHVTFTPNDSNTAPTTWEILRLKEKELWAKFTDSNNNQWEMHLVPKS